MTKKTLYKLRVLLRYGDDIADEICKDMLFEFEKDAEKTAAEIAKSFPGAGFRLSETTEKTIKTW